MNDYITPEFEFISLKELTDIIRTSVEPEICLLDMNPGNDEGGLDI